MKKETRPQCPPLDVASLNAVKPPLEWALDVVEGQLKGVQSSMDTVTGLNKTNLLYQSDRLEIMMDGIQTVLADLRELTARPTLADLVRKYAEVDNGKQVGHNRPQEGRDAN